MEARRWVDHWPSDPYLEKFGGREGRGAPTGSIKKPGPTTQTPAALFGGGEDPAPSAKEPPRPCYVGGPCPLGQGTAPRAKRHDAYKQVCTILVART
jgi:hypothetical protein